jgi:hypothetical protein
LAAPIGIREQPPTARGDDGIDGDIEKPQGRPRLDATKPKSGKPKRSKRSNGSIRPMLST